MSPGQDPQPPDQPRGQGQTADSGTGPTADQTVAKTKVGPTTIVGRVVGGLGLLVLLLLSFLPYYHADASYMGYSDTRSTNAWDSWVSVLGIVLLLLGSLTEAAATSGRLTGRSRNPALVGGAVATTVALPFFLSSMSTWPDYSDWKDAVSATGVSLSQARDVGFFLVLVCTIVIVGLSWALVGASWRAWAKTGSCISAPAASGLDDQASRSDSPPLAAPGPGREPAPPATLPQQPPDHQQTPTADG